MAARAAEAQAPARKPPAASAPSARCSRAGRRCALPPLQLEPHHVDIIALALIAIGIFLAGVAYLHWAGGALGDGAVTGCQVRVRGARLRGAGRARRAPARWS